MKQTEKYGAISSGHDLTSQAGIDMLTCGGNAFDAAIAASFMACVCEPILASPGGGGFANIYTPNESYILDFFAQTPLKKNLKKIDFRAIQADFGTTTQTFHIGLASSATPGFIPGLINLYKSHASLPLATLVRPAITAANGGVTVNEFQYFLSTVVEPILRASPQSQEIFAPNGHLIKAGEQFKNPALGNFFNEIKNHGIDAFPASVIAQAQNKTGHLAKKDFETYQPIIRQPKIFHLDENQILLNPLPAASGVLIALAFQQLQNITNPTNLDIAQALSFSDTTRTALNSDLKALKSMLNPSAHRGTTHISVVDKNHNACAITLSNGEGNGHIVNGCGFMLNNMLGETDVNPDGKRGWRENIRLSSMMCPTIVSTPDDKLLVLGSGGSNRIRSAIFQVLVHSLMQGQDPASAINAPRLHPENQHLDFEDPHENSTMLQLQKAFPDNRVWADQSMFFGGTHLVGITPDGNFFGAGDARRNGSFKTC